MVRQPLTGAVAVLALAGAAMPCATQARGPLSDESFRIGTSGTLCRAQGRISSPLRRDMFDRGWTLICRDAAQPIGDLFALRGGQEAVDRVADSFSGRLACGAGDSFVLADVGQVAAFGCRDRDTGLAWARYQAVSGGTAYVVQGLASYDGALKLALRSVAANRTVEGEVKAVATGLENREAFYRLQRQVTDAGTILGMGYRSNNAGNFAEAVEFFQAGTEESGATGRALSHEARINRALQLSNLGQFAQADALFAQARAMQVRDPVQVRLARNFEAMNALGRSDPAGALAILDRPLPVAAAQAQSDSLIVDEDVASALNSGAAGQLSGQAGEAKLSPLERVAIIDAQAMQLRGSALRLAGRNEEALPLFDGAEAAMARVRDGRVLSTARLRAQILTESALALEALGRMDMAEDKLRRALDMVATRYPASASMSGVQAKLAAFLARRGQDGEAMRLYGGLIRSVAAGQGALTGFEHQLNPYFDLLAARAGGDPAMAADMLLAGQTLVRPGAAETLQILGRQLQGRSGEASALFRQLVSLDRDMERARVALAQARNPGEQASVDPARVAGLEGELNALGAQQVRTLDALSAYPEYGAISTDYLTLPELRGLLKEGEAYLKVAQAGDGVYAIFVSATTAKGWKLPLGAAELDERVRAIRDSISVTLNGVQATYPFDVDAARQLYADLLGPVDGDLAGIRHLIFEPDGALLKLPVNLLVRDDKGVAAYHARVDAGGDEYDFTGIDWLGRDMAVSTSLSVGSFRFARNAPASHATRSYLGLGQNLPVGNATGFSTLRSADAGMAEGCEWPAAMWNQPIAATELKEAAKTLGPGSSELMIGGQFTDSAIRDKADLNDFRIVHFATHGLLAPPRKGCPARPALLTSFGGGGSDGLLQFGEIFDLSMDAELVILSACDTAGQADLTATREAGLTTGGGEALDGLVRAFIGAGGRMVIASHWPAPDDYNATYRLMDGLFRQGRQASVADALRAAQTGLMDDPDTSHPFYWSGFAIVGDGERHLATGQ